MPHYQDGSPARLGDFAEVVVGDYDKGFKGEVVKIAEGTDTCNLTLARVVVYGETKVEDGVRSLVADGYPDCRATTRTATARNCKRFG